LTESPTVSRELGTRHRAALGVTEGTDAIAVVVSEETGAISVAYNGRLVRRLDEGELGRLLRRLYQPVSASPWWVKRNGTEKK